MPPSALKLHKHSHIVRVQPLNSTKRAQVVVSAVLRNSHDNSVILCWLPDPTHPTRKMVSPISWSVSSPTGEICRLALMGSVRERLTPCRSPPAIPRRTKLSLAHYN